MLYKFFIVAISAILLLCSSCSSDQNQGSIISPPSFTAKSTETVSATPAEATPTPDLGRPDALGIYIENDGNRIFLDSFASDWVAGNDIDCFEAITSTETILSGNFAQIWGSAWDSFTNTQSLKIGYSVNIFPLLGESVYFDIKAPDDALKHTELIEIYLYDDIHVDGGWYSHLESDDIDDETIITSIKLTATQKQAEIEKIDLTAYIYSTKEPDEVLLSRTISIINTSVQ